MAQASPHEAVRSAALGRVHDVKSLSSVARKAAHPGTALEAAQRIADRAELLNVAVKTDHKDAGVAALVRAVESNEAGELRETLDLVAARAKRQNSVKKEGAGNVQALDETEAARRVAVDMAAASDGPGGPCRSDFAVRRERRAKNSLGDSAICSPATKSLICVDKISRAMPLVKPRTTGRGMNFTACPNPVTASSTRSTPAIIVTISSPGSPCAAMMPATMTTNAPVGPPIWIRGSAKQRHQKAAEDSGVNAGLRRHAGGDAERYRQWQRHHADRDAGDEICGERALIGCGKRIEQRWSPVAPGNGYGRALQRATFRFHTRSSRPMMAASRAPSPKNTMRLAGASPVSSVVTTRESTRR